ncbi:MAG: transglycosylase domain-containing protein [Candidatus Borkfalkiaceae bacterium]|nr:transglycosylase domain-containing protein [Christensenellaceae bacterium]
MKVLRFAGKTILFLFLSGVVLFAGVAFFYITATKDVSFDPTPLKNYPAVCLVTDETGNQLSENEIYAGSDKIPEHVRNAFVAIEDKRFYSHHGVDTRATLRAVKNNLFSFSLKEGGSTISRQLVKNVYLSSEKTVVRKMKERKLTLEMEKRFSKDEILTAYLNRVYFGEGCYGIAPAAKTYFGKKTEDLTLWEGATLAALVKSPSLLDPFKNPEGAKRRRDLVLSEMYSQNMIGKKEYLKAKNKDITLNFKENYERKKSYVDLALKEACSLLGVENENGLGGYTVRTHYNEQMEDSLPLAEEYGLDCNFAVTVLSNREGTVLAYASDVGEMKRIPASCAKPWLVYAPAINEKIITEASVLNDVKTDFGKYSPSNYGDHYRGAISAKDALAYSSNVSAVQVYRYLGDKKAKYYAKKMGISVQGGDLSVALGNLSGGLTLRELASAYLPFSREGNYVRSRIVSEIFDEKGKSVYRSTEEDTFVFSPETCYIVRDMLSACVEYGTAKKCSVLPFTVYAKTGTNGDKTGNLDAYCVAFTKDYTVAVWLGYQDGKRMRNGISGGNYPAAIAKDVFSNLYENRSPTPFEVPDGVLKVFVSKDREGADAKLLASSEKDGTPFYFIKGTEPKYRKPEIKPIIKDYKITNKIDKFEIVCKTEPPGSIRVEENGGERVFTIRSGETLVVDGLKEGVTYEYVLTPFILSDGSPLYGDSLKLPPVKTDGKRYKDDFEWWNE